MSIQHDITERKRAEANLRDSEEQLRALTRKLAHDANHDALTGLPNRSLFEDRLEAALDRARRTGLPAAVLFVDLDRFKRVNDTLGHHAGDELLRQAARRLAGVARRDDTVCRRGGDEFLMVLAELRDPQDAARAAQRLLDALLAPFEVDGRELVVSASVGLALFPQDGADASTLQRHADVAMYRAKANGADRFECFTPDMNETAHERLELEGDLRRALEHGDELEAYYQPLIDPATGAVVGLEALVRWRHPRLGLLEPARFLPVAEESSLIGALGVWMLGEACRQNAEWQRRGLRAVRVAVNVSALQFDRGDLTLTVARALEASGLESRWLELELTETLVTRAPVGAAEQLERLRALGVSVAVDDFGTGYSSLGQLRRLPTDALKIDRSFIAELAEVASAESLVEAMIVLGRSLGMRVVAEGVETSGQLDLLRSLGCDEVQGFLFARPMPADALEVFLAERLKATA